MLFDWNSILNVVNDLCDLDEIITSDILGIDPKNFESSTKSNILKISKVPIESFIFPIIDKFFREDDLVA